MYVAIKKSTKEEFLFKWSPDNVFSIQPKDSVNKDSWFERDPKEYDIVVVEEDFEIYVERKFFIFHEVKIKAGSKAEAINKALDIMGYGDSTVPSDFDLEPCADEWYYTVNGKEESC